MQWLFEQAFALIVIALVFGVIGLVIAFLSLGWDGLKAKLRGKKEEPPRRGLSVTEKPP